MNDYLVEMTIGIETSLVTPLSLNYSVPSWPPPLDWPVIIDKDGVIISRWSDSRWNLTPWAGHAISLNFGDGEVRKGRQAEPLDTENANILRLLATWLIWGPQALRNVITIRTTFTVLRPIFVLCSRNGISAAKLMRFPRVFEQLPEVIRAGNYAAAISLLQRIYDARDFLGFTLVDQSGLNRMIASTPNFEQVQTPYIPPRIWVYQVTRLRECLLDFQEHQEQIDACFHFCLDAYAKKRGSLQAALMPKKTWDRRGIFNADFINQTDYPGKFHDVAAHFGIADLLFKWVRDYHRISDPRNFSDYFSLVTFAGLAYICNFTLQRREEVGSLRSSCLRWEDDEQWGRVPIICGETTKTVPDSDARWVASPSVEIAVKTLSSIARLRMICDVENPAIQPSAADQNDPYLSSTATEPWGRALANSRPYNVRTLTRDFRTSLQCVAPMLFQPELMTITPTDLEIAKRITPNLPEEEFAVGKIWPLAWHQYRRTGAVNMFASGTISDQTMQQQLKHSSRLMPLYYGRNHSRLCLNKEVQSAVMIAMYQAQAELVEVVATGDRFVSPNAPERKEALATNVLSAKDTKDLIAMAKNGVIAFRENRLGGCMKAGVCEYGGIESVSRCAGGDSGKPCTEVLYDRKKEPQIRADICRVDEEIKMLPLGHPRSKALATERRAMENYLNAISS